jgi:hypothetical protein
MEILLLVIVLIVFLYGLACLLNPLFEKSKAKKQMLLDLKLSFVNETLSEFFEDVEYNAKGSIDHHTIRSAELIEGWDSSYDTTLEFTGSDYFKGKYKGCEVECCDFDVTKCTRKTETDSDGKLTESEDYETLFKGQWMICKLRKPVPGKVRVREAASRATLSPLRFIAGDQVRVKSDVETENIAFNEKFQILGDGHSAFLILTPHFMDYVLSTDSKANGRTMLCFWGDRVHIGVHNGKDLFEVKRKKELKNIPALKERIQGELKYLTDILDELFQNDNLF